MSAIETLKPYLEALRKVHRLGSTVGFDMMTVCPGKEKPAVAEAVTYLQELADKAIFQDEGFYKALKGIDLDSLGRIDQVLVKRYLDEIEFRRKSPAEKRKEWAKAYAESSVAWERAYHANDYSLYAPYLEKTLQAAKEEASYRQKEGETLYEVCLRKSDEGLKVKDLDAVFSKLADFIKEKLKQVEKTPATLNYVVVPKLSIEEQKKATSLILDCIGYDKTRGTVAMSTHPFSDFLGKDDARLTNRYDADDWRSSAFTAFHEGGHCLEFQGWTEEEYGHYVDGMASTAICETHSRLFENLLARDRLFVPNLMKILAKAQGKEAFDMSEADFYRHINKVCPSFIRTEADELTYTLHIVIRYIVEKEMIDGNLNVYDAKERWNDLYEHYLGIRPASDKEVILQDVHWSDGSFGYFPSYALGNLYGAMLLEEVRKRIDVDSALRSGRLYLVKDCLNQIDVPYDYLPGPEWIKKVTGKELSADAFISYIDKKYPII